MSMPSVEMGVRLKFSDAGPADAAMLAGLLNAAAGALAARHGDGPWWSLASERGALLMQRNARVRVGRVGKRIHAALRLATKKPWAIDAACFTPVKRPLYLSDMVVSVAHQGMGLGRQALADAIAVARAWPANAIRLDAWDADAGAGGFYAACGFQERGRVVYRGNPLAYYEFLLDEAG
jgi:GNAT superfamily N-acetyltransferase